MGKMSDVEFHACKSAEKTQLMIKDTRAHRSGTNGRESADSRYCERQVSLFIISAHLPRLTRDPVTSAYDV